MNNIRHILITGASSGIGFALAGRYAKPGVKLYLSGRNPERLDEIVNLCRSKGAHAEGRMVDVGNEQDMTSWINEVDSRSDLHLVIANAGISAGTGGPLGETGDQVRTLFRVNIDGVINTVQPAYDVMKSRRHGQIAIISSIAGFRGLPSAPAYCASKAAVKVYGEGLRGYAREDGIRVNVVCPGYVESRMTAANNFPMPFLMDADRAARIIQSGLARNRGRIVFPWQMHAVACLFDLLPSSWLDRILAGLPRKA